jgi:L-ascorbate metabolism protein UlaG (beta-lactamase superfamily)
LARAGLEAHAEHESITWLGHAAFLIRVGGKTLLTDPYLSEYASPLGAMGPQRFVPPGLAVGDLPPIDVLIVSHNHYDHLDLATVESLPGKERIVVLVPLGLGDVFRERGYVDVRELDWHQSVEFDGITVTALPAIHFSRRGYSDINRTLWMGTMIDSGRSRIYFSGDTGYGPVFARLGAKYGPFDLALVPIGAYLPESIMSPVHTTPEEAVALGLDLRAQVLLAHHWGTVVLSDEPPFEPPGGFLAAGHLRGLADDRLWLLRIGETRPVLVSRASIGAD